MGGAHQGRSSRHNSSLEIHGLSPLYNTGLVSEPVQPHIRVPLLTAAPISRLRREFRRT